MKANPRLVTAVFSAGLIVFGFGWSVGSPTLLAQDVVVSQASPSNAPQGSVNLNVRVTGNGFKKGAVAKWFVTGTTNPGGVTVNSTTYLSSTDLIANITVAADAQTQLKFDVQVTLTSGRTGKGIELFKVIYNPPDPAIAFTDAGLTTLWVMNADGTNQIALLKAANKSGITFRSPNWSPDGTQLVFESNIQGNGIYVINKDGTGLRKVIAKRGNSFGAPVWSPAPTVDGQWKIAFVDYPSGQSCEDLYLVNLDGTGLENLTNTPDFAEYWPTWDPFATRLAATSWGCTTGNVAGLFEFDLGLVSGLVGISSRVNLTAAGPLQGVQLFNPDWAKTQDKIVLNSGGNLWVISLADPGNPVNLTNSPVVCPPCRTINAAQGSWSPDDSKIVFLGMYIINSDGTGLTSLGVAGGSPDWRRCGPTGVIACAP